MLGFWFCLVQKSIYFGIWFAHRVTLDAVSKMPKEMAMALIMAIGKTLGNKNKSGM
jgi:hypothetical protein